jgi:hypothetical protein
MRFKHKCVKKRDYKTEYKYLEMIDHYEKEKCDEFETDYMCPYIGCGKKEKT